MGKYLGGRLCSCGCGLQAKKCYNSKGIFKQYCKYADGHRPKGATEKQIEAAKRNVGMGNPRALPMFSKRLHKSSDGCVYYVIKIHETGRWMLEHRYIYEQFYNYKLKPKEIVHHINGNTLDNNISNLKLMTSSEHSIFHHKGIITHNHCGKTLPEGKWSTLFDSCVICGLNTSSYASRGVCHRCNEYFRRNQRYKT